MPQLASLSDYINRVFRRIKYGAANSSEIASSSRVGQLALDVYDTNDAIIVVSPLAGITLEDIELELEENVLTIKGERKNEKNVSFKSIISKECFWGKFARSIVLPSDVQQEKIKANYKNGILTIHIPKMPKMKSKTIKIDIK